ncbi:MAG: tetrahydrofolate dehydrogenase/cyclohydrolase catalytic domain-containing protein, partial [Candidatus Thermoplasmatota archaeon]|nr:tetrahydrofolate dehydrogenase/cyclohydrolase catalytic domain-containing protein [Candidatus Thermoplasmatota archaeon]
NVSKEILQLKSNYKIYPHIVTIKIGSDPSSDLYLKLRDNACKEVGINTSVLEFKENVSEKEVLESINNLNFNENVHGVLIQLPVPKHISSDNLFNALNPKKDVEGLNPYNLGRILNGDKGIIPITPLSVLTILDYEKTSLQGKNIVIINHSKHIGKPLATLFLNKNATVSVCHIYTKDLKSFTTQADILVSATGVPKLIKNEHVKKNVFIIDVGIIKTKQGICGDVDFEDVKEKASKITPVPGGVGPVTVACSLLNMIKTFKNCVEE